MSSLTPEQLSQYQHDGYISPIDIFSAEEVKIVRDEIESIEKNWPDELIGVGRNNVHMISPVFDQVVHNSKILDAVEDLIGRDILAAGTTLFIKDPEKKSFVSWHQDAKYQGFKPHNFVTAWVAITDSNKDNGCMLMWPGSHSEIKDHNDTFDENNILTRGQTVPNVPIHETVPIELKAGQMSLHHPLIVHGSGENKTNDRRIGFVIQSYIGSDVDQVAGEVYVQQARGEDPFKYHPHVPRPTETMNKDDLELRHKANEDLQEILYKGSKEIRNL